MVIAIDGPAGVGKSSIAKMVAERLKISFLNSGNFYRALTFVLNSKQIKINQKDSIIDIAKNLNLSIIDDKMFLDNKNIEQFLRTDSVDSIVAEVSAYPEIREVINGKIKEIYKNKNFVCEGRDMTTVVFPNATYKFFLDADPEVRAERRQKQGTSNLSYNEILNKIKKRDLVDKNKVVGSLKVATDSIYIDTSTLTIEQVFNKILSNIEYKGAI